MESIINSIISSYLAEYLEINPEKTKLSILSGTVDLFGVKFKSNLFTTLNLPYLELVDGYIGKIHIDLSLPRFYLYPINVHINKIYVKVKPKNMNKIQEKEILNTFEIFKKKRLQQLEELMNIKFSSIFGDEEKNKKDEKGGITMVENIINNLHIKIQNLVFIFDDCISNPKYPITLGITLNKIFIDSTPKNFEYEELTEEEKLSPFKYKKFSIENLNIFLDNIQSKDIFEKDGEIYTKLNIREETKNNLDLKEKSYLGYSLDFYLYCESEIQFYSKDYNYHSYLLRDLNPEIRLIINEDYYKENNKEPQMKGTVDIKTISLEISNKQIKALTNTINYISLKDFYQQTTIDNYFNEVEKIDNDLIRNYLEEYSQYYKTKYIEIYKNDKENKKFLNNMEKIEKNLRIDNIIALREMGKDIINNMIEIGKIDKEIKNSEGGFFSFFWSKNNEEIDKLKLEREKKIKEQKELQIKNSTLNQFQEYVSGIIQNIEGDKTKEDKEEFSFEFIMEKLNLIIKEEKNTEMNEIFEINFIKFKSELILKSFTQSIRLTLKDMKINQFLSENKNYETILYSEEIDSEKNEEENSLILIEFEHNIKLEISPFKFKLHFGKQMFIIIDYYYLYYLYNLFLKHISALDFNNLSSLVNDKITNIVKIGYNKLIESRAIQEEKEDNNNKLFNIHVDISLTAPILLFPLYFRDINNKKMLFISLGVLKIKSELADINDENNIYDKYIVEFSNFIMKTIDCFDSKEIIKDDIGENIFYKTSFNVELKNYIFLTQKKRHKTKDFSPLIININLNDIKLSLCEEQIIFFINYLENFLRTKYEFEKEENEKEKEIKEEVKVSEIVEGNKENKEKKENIILNEEKDIKEIKENKPKGEKEITNAIKLSIKFGEVQLFLIRNLDQTKKVNFLSFFFKESFLDLLIKSNNSIYMDISFGHFYLYDEDLKIDENTKKEIALINPEFRYIIGTTFFDFKTPKENKVKFSEIYNYKNKENSITNKEKSEKESIKITFNSDAVTNQINVDITMCKLTICPNFSTISRAYSFLFKYLDIYNQSLTNLKFEQLKEQIKEKNKNKLEELSQTPIISEKKEVKDDNKEIILKSRDKSTMKIFFSMEGINILLPVDHKSDNTYIIYMALEMPIDYIIEIDAFTFFKNSKVIKINYLMKKVQLKIDIKNGSFSIYEFKDNYIMLNNKNKLINDFESSLFLNSFLDNKEKANKKYIKICLDKITELSMNINQIIIFQNLLENFNEFLNVINKEENNKNIEDNKKDLLEDEKIKRTITNSFIKEKQKKEEVEKIKKIETRQIEDIHYIDIYTYDIVFSNFYIKFYDIIDGLYQSLIEFSMKDTNIEFLQNSNPQDSTNLLEYLKNIFSSVQNKKKLDNYDKNNFFTYFKIKTKLEIKSLNNYLNQWEYFIEPFNIEFYYCQFLKRMIPNIELYINNMININVSLNFAKILQFIIKKFNLKKKEKKEITSNIIMDNIDTPDNSRYIGYETPLLIVENYSGVDMDIWFDNIKYDNTNKDLIIRIKPDEKYELTLNLLSKFKIEKKNNNLNSTISYKFILDQNIINDLKLKDKDLIGNNFNINYHHMDIHEITNQVKISIESCSDNLLIHHVIFSSLISLKNETKYKDIEIHNSLEKIKLKNNKRQTVPISWLLEKRSLNLIHDNDIELLNKNMNNINSINKLITFKNGNVIMIDIIKYKLNLDEYYSSKNTSDKKEDIQDIYFTELVLTHPINFVNNTPYDFVMNNNEKILSMKSASSCLKNSDLLIQYQKIKLEQDKISSSDMNKVIIKIIKAINLQILYNNKYISADSYIKEENKVSNNFSSYDNSLLILMKNNNSKEYLICRLILNNPYKSFLLDNKIYKEMEIELNSFRYEIIFDYYFVNKTFNNLFFNNKTIESINTSKENLLISAKQFLPVSKILLNNKIQLRKTEKDWSESFEFTALEKEFILNIKNQSESYNTLSIIAKVSTKFNKSIIFIIEEKFMIINELPFDIKLKEEKLNKIVTTKSKEAKALLLDQEILNNKKYCLKMGIGSCFSHLFDPSKLGSYDLLVKYDKTIFEENKIDTQNKLIEYDQEKYFPIRCTINSLQGNTIYIIFSLNNLYINQLRNYTNKTIEIFINNNNKKFKVSPQQIIPLVYINKDNIYEPFEKLKIVLENKIKTELSINEITNKFCDKNKNYYIKVSPEENNSIKSITLFSKDDEKFLEEYKIKESTKKYTRSQGAKIFLNLEGIGFSLIDETPKEIFYLSFYKIFFDYKYSIHNNILNKMNLHNSLTFSIKNMQLDYCLENAYEIVFNPTNQILPPKFGEETKAEKKTFLDKVMEVGDEDTPFIQLVLSQKTMQEKINNKIKILYTIFPEIGIIIQEFDTRINTILINCIMNLIIQYIKIFFPEEGSDNNEIGVDNINKEKNDLLEEDNIKINEIRKKIMKKGETTNQLIINVLTLSAIKANLTFKINKNLIEIKFLPELFVTILNTLCSTLTSFSDVTIKLNEFTFANVFNDFDSLFTKLYTFYKNKLLAQIYKIIFNMDLIGNPINLVEGMGTGIFEFFNEPRKGLLKGPGEFGLGIAKGARSLVSNIVGGGFKSASKITGTLLNASKNLSSLGTEEEVIIKEEEKPRGLFSGALSGIKKGFGELTSGVTGIVTKPYEETKKGGFGGFFKGLGSGMLGAVLSPINTVLTVGNEVTSGISNSEFISNKKSLRRFRLPRTLYKYIPLNPYNEKEEIERKNKRKEIERTDKVIVSLSNELLFLENSTEILMCCKLKNNNILLFTDIMIKILSNDFKKLIKKIYVCNIEKIKEKDNEIELVLKNTEHEFILLENKKEKQTFIREINKYIN